jgi:hypothetical protein
MKTGNLEKIGPSFDSRPKLNEPVYFYCSLVLPENMEELVRLITEEPADDVEEKIRYK